MPVRLLVGEEGSEQGSLTKKGVCCAAFLTITGQQQYRGELERMSRGPEEIVRRQARMVSDQMGIDLTF